MKLSPTQQKALDLLRADPNADIPKRTRDALARMGALPAPTAPVADVPSEALIEPDHQPVSGSVRCLLYHPTAGVRQFCDFAGVADVARAACELASKVTRVFVLVPRLGCQDSRRESGWHEVAHLRLLGLVSPEDVQAASASVWDKVRSWFYDPQVA